jgi:hypothetical protein
LAAQPSGYTHLAQSLDEMVSRLTRWAWLLLDELDDEDARDD